MDGIKKTHRVFRSEGPNSIEDYSQYYDDGETELMGGRYKNGRKDGTWTSYDRKGKVASTEEYRNGSRVK